MRDLQETDLQFGRDDVGPYLTRQREGRLGEEPANGTHHLQQREGQPEKLHDKQPQFRRKTMSQEAYAHIVAGAEFRIKHLEALKEKKQAAIERARQEPNFLGSKWTLVRGRSGHNYWHHATGKVLRSSKNW